MRCRRNFPAQRKKLSFAGQLCAHRSRTLPPQRLSSAPSPQVLNFASCDDLRFHDRPCRRTASGVTSHFCHLSSFLSVSQGTHLCGWTPQLLDASSPLAHHLSQHKDRASARASCTPAQRALHPSCHPPSLSRHLFLARSLRPSLVIFQLELSSHDHDTTKTKTPTT